jgi:hypothetical protein
MERKPVTSTDLSIVGYNAETQELEVTFKAGGVYVYSGVPEVVYQALMLADSHGLYFNQHIKDKYPTKKVR